MKKALKKILPLRRLWDLYNASKYFNIKYLQIFKWAIKSKEDTNFTYDLTEKNKLELLTILQVVTECELPILESYLNEIIEDNHLKNFITNKIKNSNFKNFADKEIKFSRRIGWYIITRVIKPKVIIETGVDKGMGSLVLSSALLRNIEEGFQGEYIGTDINPEAGYLYSGKYSNVGKILYGDSIKSLKNFDKKIDLFVNDSDHSSDYEAQEYKIISKNLSKAAIILGDNSHVTDKLLKFSINNSRNFLLFKEEPKNHWYPGAGIGISFPKRIND